MWTLKDGDERFPDGGASCRRSGGGGGGGRGVLADLVADLFGDITQTLRNRLAPLETLNAPVQEADPAEQQVRVVAKRHDDDGGQQLSSRGASADITPPSCLCFPAWLRRGCSCQTNQTNQTKPNILEKQRIQ